MTARLVTLMQTSVAAPSQWEGELSDGSFLYARYRHGHGVVCVGASAAEAMRGDILIEWPGDEEYKGWPSDDPRFADSFLSTEELLAKLGAVGIDTSGVTLSSNDDYPSAIS